MVASLLLICAGALALASNVTSPALLTTGVFLLLAGALRLGADWWQYRPPTHTGTHRGGRRSTRPRRKTRCGSHYRR